MRDDLRSLAIDCKRKNELNDKEELEALATAIRKSIWIMNAFSAGSSVCMLMCIKTVSIYEIKSHMFLLLVVFL